MLQTGNTASTSIAQGPEQFPMAPDGVPLDLGWVGVGKTAMRISNFSQAMALVVGRDLLANEVIDWMMGSRMMAVLHSLECPLKWCADREKRLLAENQGHLLRQQQVFCMIRNQPESEAGSQEVRIYENKKKCKDQSNSVTKNSAKAYNHALSIQRKDPEKWKNSKYHDAAIIDPEKNVQARAYDENHHPCYCKWSAKVWHPAATENGRCATQEI